MSGTHVSVCAEEAAGLPVEPFRYYQYGERTVDLDGCAGGQRLPDRSDAACGGATDDHLVDILQSMARRSSKRAIALDEHDELVSELQLFHSRRRRNATAC